MREESRGVCPSLCLLPWDPGCQPSYLSGNVVLRNRLIGGPAPEGSSVCQGRKLDAEAGVLVLVLIHLRSGCCPFGPSIRWGMFSFKEE